MTLNKFLCLALVAVYFATTCCHAACFYNAGVGCPAGKNNGDSWEENCMNCSCSNQIQGQTRLCYLPSEPGKEVYSTPLYQVQYDMADSFKVCPPGFMEVMGSNLGQVKPKLILAYTSKPIGGDVGCCDIYSSPTNFHSSCKRIKVGCEWKLVLKMDENTPCPYGALGAVGK